MTRMPNSLAAGRAFDKVFNLCAGTEMSPPTIVTNPVAAGKNSLRPQLRHNAK